MNADAAKAQPNSSCEIACFDSITDLLHSQF